MNFQNIQAKYMLKHPYFGFLFLNKYILNCHFAPSKSAKWLEIFGESFTI